MRSPLALTAVTLSMLLLATGCGAEEPAEAEVAPAAEESTPASSLPQLETGQTNRELAEDTTDALTQWFNAGQGEVNAEWDGPDGDEELHEDLGVIARSVAKKHQPEWADALLVEDYDTVTTGWPLSELVEVHAHQLYEAARGEGPTQFEVDGPVEELSSDPLTLSIPIDGEPVTISFEEDGEVMRILSIEQ
ncbi:hypothetical protein [uncultured Kocuria sp.]|uniref:hypothetical protein n=1 Tax=uncultured Kocuria sp. TaxID=259305 RepID=UPI00260ED788|nr:hypothetical protein [uncultured Kocuria sp.]